MGGPDMITEKIYGVKEEMKNAGLWKKQQPVWVSDYEKRNIVSEHDFSEWLQFVYLPNLLQQAGNNGQMLRKGNVALQAIKFLEKM